MTCKCNYGKVTSTRHWCANCGRLYSKSDERGIPASWNEPESLKVLDEIFDILKTEADREAQPSFVTDIMQMIIKVKDVNKENKV